MVAKINSIRPLLQINFGSPANAADDTLGKVAQVLVHPDTWQISHVVVQRGLFARKLLALPVELVSEARVDNLEFSLTVDDLLQKAQNPKENLLLLKEHLPVGNGPEKLGGLSQLFFDVGTRRLAYLVMHRHSLAGGEVLLSVDQLAVLQADRLEVKIPAREFSVLPHYRHDPELAEAVRQALWDFPRLRVDLGSVRVHAQCNEVWLLGHVSSETNRRLAEDQASVVTGMRAIHNELVADNELAMEIASALGKHEEMRGLPIGVYPDLGVVHLRGIVPTERAKQIAEEIANAAIGTESVQNDLVISEKHDVLPALAGVNGREDIVPGTEESLANVKPTA
ncbi:MAG TPA: BON domain-containing protein [Ktedonobacterales bacterium]|nr:BON domain-containing protein [Ktedonobacterales bacterium]